MAQHVSIPLLVTLIALLVLAGFQLREHEVPAAKPSVPEATELASVRLSQEQLPQFSLPPIEEFSETLARPLFYEAREPPDPVTMNSKDPQARSRSTSSEDLILSAIVLSSEEQFVLLQDPGKESLSRVEKGEEVAGWSLDEIRRESVLLRRDTRTKVVRLWRFQRPPMPVAKRQPRDGSKPTLQQRRRRTSSRTQRRDTRHESHD